MPPLSSDHRKFFDKISTVYQYDFTKDGQVKGLFDEIDRSEILINVIGHVRDDRYCIALLITMQLPEANPYPVVLGPFGTS